MWKHYKLFCNRYAVQRRSIFSSSRRTAGVVLNSTDVVSEDPEYVLPKETRVVICGGGVMGGAVAYHLSLMGLGPETILIESGRYMFFRHIFQKVTIKRVCAYLYLIVRLGGGTTWHTSGLVGAFKPSLAQVKLAQDSIALYEELEKKNLPTGWKQCGSLSLARTRDRMTTFRRMKAQSV